MAHAIEMKLDRASTAPKLADNANSLSF